MGFACQKEDGLQEAGRNMFHEEKTRRLSSGGAAGR
jgi:hypothetical protein